MFFHNMVRNIIKMNQIHGGFKDGVWMSKPGEVNEAFLMHFKIFFNNCNNVNIFRLDNFLVNKL